MKKITFLCSLSIAACAFLSLSCKHQNNLNDYQRWSPYMVIDAASFESSHSNACTNSNQCALPLSCSENRCKVPPSIRNEKSDITPTLQYRNPDTSTGTIYLELAKTADEREVGARLPEGSGHASAAAGARARPQELREPPTRAQW